jgi:hypothetical protein
MWNPKSCGFVLRRWFIDTAVPAEEVFLYPFTELISHYCGFATDNLEI